MYGNSFWVENLIAEKKQFALDASPSPFEIWWCEGIYRAIWAISKGCPYKISNICCDFKDLYRFMTI
jgi:hypothetical protein